MIQKELLEQIITNRSLTSYSLFKHLITYKFIIVRSIPINSLFPLLQSLHSLCNSNDEDSIHFEENFFFLLYENAIKVWSDDYFLRNCSEEKHELLSRIIIWSLQLIKKKEKSFIVQFAENQEYIDYLLRGVHCHIASPNNSIRRFGMVVGEVLSYFIDENHPLKFEYDPYPDYVDDLLPSSHPSFDTSIDQNVNNNIDIDDHEISDNEEEQKNKTKLKKNRTNEYNDGDVNSSDSDDPDRPFLPSQSDSDNDEEDFDNNTQDESEDEDLVSYNLDDDERDLLSIPIPIFPRDCLALFRERENPDAVETLLKASEKIIRRKSEDLVECAVEFTRALLYLENEYNFQEFEELRLNSLIALAVCETLSVVRFLSLEFYSPHHSIQRRMDILFVLTKSAQEIANSKKYMNLKEENELVSDGFTYQKANNTILNIIPSQTVAYPNPPRKWTKNITTPQSFVNPFENVVGQFFFSLIKRYDSKEFVFYLNFTFNIQLNLLMI